MPLPIAPAFLGSLVVMIASAGPPTVDIRKTCRTAENDIVKLFGSTTGITVESCTKQENEAYSQIVKNWSTYPATDRALCATASAYLPSYVEWLTCFEMQRDVRKIRADESKAKPAVRRRGRSAKQ